MDEEEVVDKSKMEDVRMSNFAFSQTKIGEYITLIFAIIGIESAIVASEMSNTKG
jgi:hypothetical protein